MCEFRRTWHEPSEAYCSHNKPGKAHNFTPDPVNARAAVIRRRYYGRLLMCKRTMYKRARIPMGTTRMRQQWCPGRFFLAPAKTAWERGYRNTCGTKDTACAYARGRIFQGAIGIFAGPRTQPARTSAYARGRIFRFLVLDAFGSLGQEDGALSLGDIVSQVLVKATI